MKSHFQTAISILAILIALVSLLENRTASLFSRIGSSLSTVGGLPFKTRPIPDGFESKILRYDPLIIHIKDFIPLAERQYLKSLSLPLLERSTVLLPNGSHIANPARTSSTAFLPDDDPIVRKILDRASRFQGYIPVDDVQVTSYQPGQQFTPHFDWFQQPDLKYNRLSTFFVILEADCENCGTQFPRLKVNWTEHDSRLCEFVDCEQEKLTTRNVEGSALYWRNLDAAGRGRRDVLHAGLPATNGTKVGLNIWTEVEVEPNVPYLHH